MITAQKCQAVRLAIDIALAQIARDHNVTFSLGKIWYTDIRGTTKLTIEDGDRNQVQANKMDELLMHAPRLGIKSEWINQEFVHSGTRYRMSGYNGRKRRKCIELIRIEDDRVLICDPEFIKYAFKA